VAPLYGVALGLPAPMIAMSFDRLVSACREGAKAERALALLRTDPGQHSARSGSSDLEPTLISIGSIRSSAPRATAC